MKITWEGIYPAITTKFKGKENESLDLTIFENNLQAQLDAGIHGVVLAGSLGEASTLKQEEKIQLLKNH